MGVLDRGVVGRLVPPALPPVVPEAPLRRLVLAAAVRGLAVLLAREAAAGLEDTVWAMTVSAGVSAGVAVAAGFAGAAAAGMAVTGVVAAAAGAGLLADAFGAAALALAWAAVALAAAARDRGVAMAEGDGAR